MVRYLLIGIMMCTAVTVGLTISSAADAQRMTTAPTCQASQLEPEFGTGQGGAGTLQDTWRVTNVSARTCRMAGYPSVVNYGSDGRPLPMHVTHMGTAHAVILRHGQHASFDLRYTNPVIGQCTAEKPAHMTIRTPGARLPVIVDNGLPSCRGRASESPLRHGD